MEAGYVRKMFDAAQRREGFAALCKEMAAAGITGKRGKPIKYPQIYEILRNEKYTGVYLYSPVEADKRAKRRSKPDAIRKENALPIIVDRAQFMEVQKIMDERKQTGRRDRYLCSGLVYCRCGAKMHGITTRRKGHEYQYYTCSKKCGAPVVHMEEVDRSAREYVQELLNTENQQKIADALRQYQAGEGRRMSEFKQALKKRIRERQAQYDALMQNLASGALPPEIVADMGEKMREVKQEIAILKATEPPKDFTVDTIKSWLESIKAAPDREAVRLLIERIDTKEGEEKEKTAFEMQSTLKAVLSKHGCGGRI
nr:recombinase family protein [Anaerofilum hominis]